MRFAGKVAIVTGAAGTGIGQATARELAQEGARVAITDRNEARASKLAEELRSHGAQVLGLRCDVSSSEEVKAMVRQVVDHWGQVDILVNNAAFLKLSPVIEMEEAIWDRVVNTSLKGTFLCSQAVLPYMVQHQSGAIINLSSIEAIQGSDKGYSHYAAAKAGIMAFTKTLAQEAGRYGIRVNCICPGLIWNEGLSKSGLPQEYFDEMRLQTPLGRAGIPREVARAILFLCSDDASFITGATLCVNGGRLSL